MPNHQQTLRFNTQATRQLRFLRRWYGVGTLDVVVEVVFYAGLHDHMRRAAHLMLEENSAEFEAFVKSVDWKERRRLRFDGEDIDDQIPF